MPHGKAHGLAKICNAMGNPIRFRILALLGEGICNVNDLVRKLDLEQSKVSKHLAVLLAAGLVKYTADGRRRCYDLERPKTVRRILALFQKLREE